jgi:hypothetical protein
MSKPKTIAISALPPTTMALHAIQNAPQGARLATQQLLNALAEETGDGKIRHAANVISVPAPWRELTPEEEAVLREAQALVLAGASEEDAASRAVSNSGGDRDSRRNLRKLILRRLEEAVPPV